MKYARLTYCITIALIAINIAACKKNSSGTIGGAQIIYINYYNNNGDVVHYHITYTTGNNVDSIISTGGGADTGYNNFLSFSYRSSSYLITDANNKQATVDLNTSLQIDTVFSGTGSVATFLQYYNGLLGAVNTIVTSGTYPYTATQTATYYYTSGNVTQITGPAGTVSYSYNTGKGAQIGDALRIDQFLTYGRAYTISSDLPVEMDLSNIWQEKYNYIYDGSGRISQFMRVTNNTSGGINDTAWYNYIYNF
jgi:hypothetical protein